MKLNRKQEMAIINSLTCIQLMFIGYYFWCHSYDVLWIWGLWLLGNVIIVKLYYGKVYEQQAVEGNSKI
jgi:hypothetical protein